MSRNSNSGKRFKAKLEIAGEREENATAQDAHDASNNGSRQLVSLMHRMAPRGFDRTNEMAFRLDGFVEIFTSLQPIDE